MPTLYEMVDRIDQRLAALENRVDVQPTALRVAAIDDDFGRRDIPISDRQVSNAIERVLLRGDTLDRIVDTVRAQLLNTTTRNEVVEPLVNGVLGSAPGGTFTNSLNQISANLLDAVLRGQRLR
ncbi:MAG: hypothetical protein AB7G06_05695 [Bdellovibrionales bacterium]